MSEEPLQRAFFESVTPHHWSECVPVVADPDGKVDMKDDKNRAVRKIFSELGQLDRIKWHQACCQSRVSPQHDAVVQKIIGRLKAELPGDFV